MEQRDSITVPRGGFKERFWKYIILVTGERSFSRFLRQGLILTLFSSFPTVVGSVLRGYVYRNLLGRVGSSCFIEKNVRLRAPQRVFLGDRVFIGEGSYIDASDPGSEIHIKNDVSISQGVVIRASGGKVVINEMVNLGTRSIIFGPGDVEIGKYSLIAQNVDLMSGLHTFKDPSTPIRFQGGTAEKILIGEDVWLGGHVTVLPKVAIGKGSVIGSGAVVTKNIPAYSIAVGVPAKVIGKRKTEKAYEKKGG